MTNLQNTQSEVFTEKFYSPFKFYIRYDGDVQSGRYDEADYWRDELSQSEAVYYMDDIKLAIRRDIDDLDTDRGLAEYIDTPLSDKVESLFPTVELHDDQLWCVADVRISGSLSREEEAELKDWWTGQLSDGWGEGFEQRGIKVGRDELYVEPWHSGGTFFVYTADTFAKHILPGREEYAQDKIGDLLGYMHTAKDDIPQFLLVPEVQRLTTELYFTDMSLSDMREYLGEDLVSAWGGEIAVPDHGEPLLKAVIACVEHGGDITLNIPYTPAEREELSNFLLEKNHGDPDGDMAITSKPDTDFMVSLKSDSDLGRRLIPLLDEKATLSEANMVSDILIRHCSDKRLEQINEELACGNSRIITGAMEAIGSLRRIKEGIAKPSVLETIRKSKEETKNNQAPCKDARAKGHDIEL
jgi:hypothetical protein